MGRKPDLPCDIEQVIDLLGIEVIRDTGTQLHCRCPFCADRKAHMNVKIRDNVFRCNRCGKGGGILHLYAEFCEVTLHTAYEELCKIFGPDSNEKPREYKRRRKIIETAELPIASAEVRDNTYSNLLSLLTLCPTHQASLKERGLTRDEIDWLGYRTTPTTRLRRIVTELLERGCVLDGVPGFYCQKDTGQWTLDIRGSGIMLPDRNLNGQIEAIQVRLDKVYNQKFYNLTSIDQYYGTQSKCCPHYVGVHEGDEVVCLTDALKNESNSVFNQRRLLQDYYDTHESLHGYKVIVFCDDGVTGTHFDRPKFDELIEMARNQEIHCIMVKDLSRFGRNFLEMGNYLELILPLYGVRFISINDAFDSDDYLGVTGGLELALRNLINNMYSRDLSTKVRSAFRTRNLRGEYWGGNGFYGYQVHPHNKKRLIVDEQVRDIIVMIFESCVAGMTTSEIAQMLNDMGIPSPLEHKRRNGGFYNGVVKEETGIWLKGAVRKILTDERYTGKMITNTRETEEVGKPKMRSLPRDQWIIVPGTHEAIISEELFRTAQNALQGRIRNVNKNTAGNRANNLFVCGCCGRKLRKNPAKEPHLVCPKNDSIKGAECAGLFVNQAQIEQAVLQMLREQSRSFLEQHCLMQACIDKKLSSIQTELDANTNMTRRLQSRKAELYEQYRAGRISREKFADIQKTDSEKLARLSSRAEEIKRLLVEHYESRGNLAAGKRTADQIILLKDYDPEIIRNFVERVRVYPSGEIEIDMRTSSGFEFVTAS